MDTPAIRFYTVREAAAILKVHERTVLRWVKSGRIAGRRIGRLIRIEEAAIRHFGEAAGALEPPFEGWQEPAMASTGQPRRGSPQAVLQCAGLISKADAEALRKAIREAHDECDHS